MNKYLLQMNGSNFFVNMDGKLAKHGFLQMFQVEAESPEQAEILVVKKIKENADLIEMTQNTKDDAPVFNIEEMSIVEEFIEDFESESGRIWYQEKKWWQFWK